MAVSVARARVPARGEGGGIVTMPRDLTEEAVCGWIRAVSGCDIPAHNCRSCRDTARAVLALVEAKVREAVDEIRDYSVKAAATCREAEGERARDIASRPDNVMLDILREQHYAWGQKASSYDALVVFIDAIVARVMKGAPRG